MRKVAAIYAFLFGLNAGAWASALWAFWTRPILLGTALLAYTFGLRHAVDADHIFAMTTWRASCCRSASHDARRIRLGVRQAAAKALFTTWLLRWCPCSWRSSSAALAAGVFVHQFSLSGGVWDKIRGANDNFGTLGFIIVGVFATTWITSVAVYKLLGYDEVTAA